jgi:predicted TIM-barrel fold metal-dependent hydrolase
MARLAAGGCRARDADRSTDEQEQIPMTPNDAPAILVSCDSHLSARMADMRAYCPRAYLEQFEEEVESNARDRETLERTFDIIETVVSPAQGTRARDRARSVLAADGGHDMAARLRDMDVDGIAAAVIFNGAQGGDRIPFTSLVGPSVDRGFAYELQAVGLHMYNEWLKDVCADQPARHVPLAQLPYWDIDAMVREVEWAYEVGFRAVNFPGPRPGLPQHDDPLYEPFWDVCNQLDVTLVNHGVLSGAGFADLSGPVQNGGTRGALVIEEAQPVSRRSIARMIFSGVFERHPGLKVVFTEQMGTWLPELMCALDRTYKVWDYAIGPSAPKLPSEYCRTNVFVGASFLAPWEREAFEESDLTENILWGSDYPHVEGAWRPILDGDEAPMTQLSLRHSFGGAAPEVVRSMTSENAIRVFGMDRAALQEVADRIDAPSIDAIRAPLEGVPVDGSRLAFR